MTEPTAELLARAAVSDWLEDSIDFCYIYEHEMAEEVPSSKFEDAHEIALGYIKELADLFDRGAVK